MVLMRRSMIKNRMNANEGNTGNISSQGSVLFLGYPSVGRVSKFLCLSATVHLSAKKPPTPLVAGKVYKPNSCCKLIKFIVRKLKTTLKLSLHNTSKTKRSLV